MRFVLLLLSILLVSPAAFADTISGMTAKDRDYTIEGDVVTIWTDSFLLNDGTGQMIVDIRPHTTHELGIAGRGYVQVSGRMAGQVFKPMVLVKPDGTNTMFTGTDTLEPLPLDDVMRNTIKHRFNPPNKNTAHATAAPSESAHTAAATKDTEKKNEASSETSSAGGQSEVQPQQPAVPVH